MNTFLNQLEEDTNFTYTENGGLAHKSTMNAVYDMFAFGAAYRNRSDSDVVLLFKNAFEEDEELALKCLFWIRDCRGGAGERRFFDLCMKWLANNYPNRIKYLIPYIPEYGRWDELYVFEGTPLESDAFAFMKSQIEKDMEDIMSGKKNIGISLLSKWLKSENCSSAESKRLAKKTRKYFGVSSVVYRKTLSKLREHIKVLEKLMSANRWDEIDFSKIPSKAGMKYKNAFARRDMIAKKYEAFAKDKNTKVNAATLYPYEIVAKALAGHSYWNRTIKNLGETDRAMVNKYWECLPNYFGDKEYSMMCVVDTSGSMTGSKAAAPINVAISLGLYCAERLNGPFKNHYISFASRPQLIKTEGIDFVDKVQRIYDTNLCDNTNLEAVFDLLLDTAKRTVVKKSDIPSTIVVISDMEIDEGTGFSRWNRSNNHCWTNDNANTMMEKMRKKWKAYGLELPKLVYWNVDARQNTILDAGPNVSFVSGMSPTIFKQVLTGKTGWDLCLEAICAERYAKIR